jgi:hypothetical protein
MTLGKGAPAAHYADFASGCTFRVKDLLVVPDAMLLMQVVESWSLLRSVRRNRHVLLMCMNECKGHMAAVLWRLRLGCGVYQSQPTPNHVQYWTVPLPYGARHLENRGDWVPRAKDGLEELPACCMF